MAWLLTEVEFLRLLPLKKPKNEFDEVVDGVVTISATGVVAESVSAWSVARFIDDTTEVERSRPDLYFWIIKQNKLNIFSYKNSPVWLVLVLNESVVGGDFVSVSFDDVWPSCNEAERAFFDLVGVVVTVAAIAAAPPPSIVADFSLPSSATDKETDVPRKLI